MRPSRRLALASAHGAVLLFGLAGVLGKAATLGAPLIVLGRALFSGVSLGALLALRRTPLRCRARRDLVALAASGVLLALHWTAFFAAVQVASVAVALLAFSTFPLFTTALEPLLLRTRPRGRDVLAAMLVLPGIYFVVPDINWGNNTTLGAAWGMVAGASFALLSIWNRRLTQRYPSAVISLYQDGAAALVLLPTLVIYRPSPMQVLHDLPLLLLLGIVCTALAHTLFIEGMRALTAQTASVIAALEPVWGILFALLLLGEVPAPRTLVGGTVILGVVMLSALVQRPPPPSPTCASEMPHSLMPAAPVASKRPPGPIVLR